MKLNRLKKPREVYSKTEHTLIAGLSGTGKGMFGEWYIPKFSQIGYKVFDINSESRGEGMYYALPQTDSHLMSRVTYLSNGLFKPQTYQNEIIMFLGHNLKDVPILPRNVKLCVFNEQWLDNEDLKKFLAFNDSQSELLEAIFELNNDNKVVLSGLYGFLKRAGKDKFSAESVALKQAGAHYASVNTIKRRARALLRSGLFFNSQSDMKEHFHYLDLQASMNDTKKITSFSTYLIEDPYIRYVCVGILMKKFIELIETRQSKTPVLFYIREANDFYYMKNPPAYVIDIQNNIEKMLRKGRSFGGAKVTLVMDTQLLSDLPDSVFNGFNKFICFRLPLSDSKLLLRKASILPNYLQKLAGVNVGEGMYVASGTFEYPLFFFPTLHKKSDPSFDVFDYLIGVHGAKDYSKSEFLTLDMTDSKDKSPFPELGGSK